MNYKILFASLLDINTKPPSLSILFFHPTLTPLSSNSSSHHSFHPTLTLHSFIPPSKLIFSPQSLAPLLSLHYLALPYNQFALSIHSFLSPFHLDHPTLSFTITFHPFSLSPSLLIHWIKSKLVRRSPLFYSLPTFPLLLFPFSSQSPLILSLSLSLKSPNSSSLWGERVNNSGREG